MIENFKERIRLLKSSPHYGGNAIEKAIFEILVIIAEIMLYQMIQKEPVQPNYQNRGF